ncbi:phage scaffolding protein [Sporosarcina sp. FSL K6-3508]|uniref:phage scaffolding protein n=1 Tax=Sporosarcina sp. FSL K6-3508 TaxID=2921557 RepID=UPI00315A4A63
MTREELKALGLSDEQIDSIMAAHGKVVNPMKEELTGAQSERNSLKTQLTERDTQLEDLRGKAQGNDDLQATIDALKEANESAKAAHQAELSKTKLNYELDRALLVNKARNPRAVRALLDSELIKLGEDGKVVGLSEQLEGLKTSDPYLFADETQQTQPAGHVPGTQQKHNDPGKPDAYQAGVKMYEQLKLNKRI